MPGSLRAIFFDAGNTLIFPRVVDLAHDLTRQGFPATAEDFYVAERAGKAKLDKWLWPQIREGRTPSMVDRVVLDGIPADTDGASSRSHRGP